MSSTTQQIDGKTFNGLDKTNSATIRRTFLERGIRPVENYATDSNSSALTKITKQHQDDKVELQELNVKLSSYLDHVHDLETFNGQLLAEIDELRKKWGNNTEQLNKTHAPQLRALREGIDDSLRDQILQQLQLKRFESDIEHIQQRINAFEDNTPNRFEALQQELNHSTNELENLKNHFDRYATELVQQRNYLANLDNEFDALHNELLNHRLERIMVENELQTLREHAAFQKANYQAQREEILSLNVPVIDLSKFYRDELVHAIFDIRKDFQTHSQTQLKELEEYYRIKTEEINQKIAEDNQRKSLINTDYEETDMSSMFSSLTDINEEYKELKDGNIQLEIDYNDTLDDLRRIREEQIREYEKLESELNQLQSELQNKQDVINHSVENNVSLQFELSTYRNLLKSEEKRINRDRQEPQAPPTSPESSENIEDYSLQKIAVKKTTTGPISFDSIDFANDCVVITHEKPFGDDQSLDNWSLHHQSDEQPEIVYQFPTSLTIKPKQTIRILSKRSPESAKTEKDVLIADQVETWGQGQVMTTRLIDKNNQEKAKIVQTRLPT